MGTRIIEKTIDLTVPPERVWEVLFGDETYRQWTAAFMGGSYAQTDWRHGSTVRFLAPSGAGLLGHIAVSRHPQLLDVEYDGVVAEGRDDTDSQVAGEFRGRRETYRLTATPGTQLQVSAPMGEDSYDQMVTAWDDALAAVEDLAESGSPSPAR